MNILIFAESGTQGRTRTDKTVKSGDFESPASTIPPLGHGELSTTPKQHRPEVKMQVLDANVPS